MLTLSVIRRIKHVLKSKKMPEDITDDISSDESDREDSDVKILMQKDAKNSHDLHKNIFEVFNFKD